jgi:predicted LPLAT superfamily acyltransferase
LKQEWLDRPEGGSAFGYQLISKFALLCGRSAARLVLYPVTLFYLLRRGPERRASRTYLSRVFGRPATIFEVARHVYCFAAVIMDRVYMLSEKFKRFDIRVTGLDALHAAMDEKRGVLIFGAHLGSFDALRVLSEKRPDVKTRVVIDIGQNPTLSTILNALNPALARSIINARQDGMKTALAIKEALDEHSLVTLMVERARPDNAVVTAEFLGHPAPFPTAPWLLAATLKAPVVLCFGFYRGGNRYDLHFESFASSIAIERKDRLASLTRIVQQFADRLTHYARLAPYNWFNFYDFWQIPAAAVPATETLGSRTDDTRPVGASDATRRDGGTDLVGRRPDE